MATATPKRLAVPGLVTTSLVTIYTVPASTYMEGGCVHFSSEHTADVLIDFYIVPSGGSASNTNKYYKASKPNGLWVPTGGSVDVDLGQDGQVLQAGEFIQVVATVTNVINYRISGVEVA